MQLLHKLSREDSFVTVDVFLELIEIRVVDGFHVIHVDCPSEPFNDREISEGEVVLCLQRLQSCRRPARIDVWVLVRRLRWDDVRNHPGVVQCVFYRPHYLG